MPPTANPNQNLPTARRILFADDDAAVYAVLDGASVPALLPRLAEWKPEHCCLYRGELPADLKRAAPYLVRLTPDSPFTGWVLSEGWGKHWGIFAVSFADFLTLRKHFRTFLMVNGPDGKPFYFRYYDPRVLRTYLPTCNAAESELVFGPVTFYAAEAKADGTLLRFRRGPSGPRCDTLPIAAEKPPAPEPGPGRMITLPGGRKVPMPDFSSAPGTASTSWADW
jgi:hypothetical protein